MKPARDMRLALVPLTWTTFDIPLENKVAAQARPSEASGGYRVLTGGTKMRKTYKVYACESVGRTTIAHNPTCAQDERSGEESPGGAHQPHP